MMLKKRNLFIVLCLAVLLVSFAFGADRTTKSSTQTKWSLLRSKAGEDPNTAIGSVAVTSVRTSANNYANKPADANGTITLGAETDGTGLLGGSKSFSTDAYAVEIIACADANDKTFTVNLYAWERSNGPGQYICSIAYTCGDCNVVACLTDDDDNSLSEGDATTQKWADTATVTIKESYANKVLSSSAQGSDGIARVAVLLYGQAFIYAEVLDADGTTGTEATDVTLYYRKVSG